MTRNATLRTLALTAALVLLGCSDSSTPVEPSQALAPQLKTAMSDSAHARHEALKEELEARKAYFKDMREANQDELRAARADWKAWKENWKEQLKLAREAWKRAHPGEKGGPEIQLLRCEPKPYDADAQIIGPNGGTLHVGDHELVIPQGALDHEELITAEAPTSSMVDVDFGPEGLQFLRPAQLKLSYQDCVRPTIAQFLIAYLGHGNQILELLPSTDKKLDSEVDAEVDHFSRYAIAW